MVHSVKKSEAQAAHLTAAYIHFSFSSLTEVAYSELSVFDVTITVTSVLLMGLLILHLPLHLWSCVVTVPQTHEIFILGGFCGLDFYVPYPYIISSWDQSWDK